MSERWTFTYDVTQGATRLARHGNCSSQHHSIVDWVCCEGSWLGSTRDLICGRAPRLNTTASCEHETERHFHRVLPVDYARWLSDQTHEHRKEQTRLICRQQQLRMQGCLNKVCAVSGQMGSFPRPWRTRLKVAWVHLSNVVQLVSLPNARNRQGEAETDSPEIRRDSSCSNSRHYRPALTCTSQAVEIAGYVDKRKGQRRTAAHGCLQQNKELRSFLRRQGTIIKDLRPNTSSTV